MELTLEIPRELLLGHWRAVHEPFAVDWTFYKDGSFSGTVARQGQRVSEFTGTWLLDATWLHSEYTMDSSGLIDAGSTDQDIFLEFTYNYFVIQTRTGKRRYERVE
jgi:hypothetical protein